MTSLEEIDAQLTRVRADARRLASGAGLFHRAVWAERAQILAPEAGSAAAS